MSERTRVGQLLDRKRNLEKDFSADKEPGRWLYYGTPYQDHDLSFAEVFPEGFLNYLRERKRKGQPCTVFDVMSPGGLLRSLHTAGCLDTGLALTLHDVRNPSIRAEDHQHAIDVIGGDILDKATWKKVEEWRMEHGLSDGFDVIVECAMGGVITLPKSDAELMNFLFNQLYRQLSKKDGLLLVEVPEVDALTGLLSTYKTVVNRTPGLIFDYYHHYPSNSFTQIRLQKSEAAPEDLPKLIHT